MKVLVFDTETTGLPEDNQASFYDSAKWPHVIQLSYIMYDTETKEILDYCDRIVKLDNTVYISPESISVHKITRERSESEGIPITQVLKDFVNSITLADIIVGHNIIFDKRIITVELYRHNMNNCFYKNRLAIPEYCTMKRTTELCAIKKLNKKTGEIYNKYPTLSELHNVLFDSVPKGTHNAIADVMICLRCYIQLNEEYDIVNDENVKLVFKTLYHSYCVL
jgi:DNA polymerase III epsilon subunit-like protein